MTDSRTILPELIPTPAQVRQARALLRIGQRELAKEAGLAVATLNAYEREQHPAYESTITKLRVALERLGARFEPSGAVSDGRGSFH